jgi:3-oxoacyl-[acyl-carrier protein] reductase
LCVFQQTLITGTNNPQGIGATTVLAFVNEGAKVALVYKKMQYKYDESKTAKNGIDRYYKALNGNLRIP